MAKSGGISCKILFYICEDKKIGIIRLEETVGQKLPDTEYSTDKYQFEYIPAENIEERKLTIYYNSEKILEIRFKVPIEEYDSEELTSFSPKNVKDMTKEELFNELCANIEETKQVYRLSESGIFPKDETKKIIEKNGKRNAEINKEIASRD